ncbi:MAG: hypothetical protein ABJA60_02000 [Nitrosospira sp.]
MNDLTELHQIIVLVDKLVQIADKEDLAECTRLLAINVAHYEMRYGALALEERLAVTSKLNENHTELLTRGLETRAGMLGNIIRGMDERLEH